jgi:hypothetical protein
MDSPMITHDVFPATEQEHVRCVMRCLHQMDDHSSEFWYALRLYDESLTNLKQFHALHVGDGRKAAAWMEIAKRVAAMNIWEFSSAIYDAKNNCSKCPVLGDLIDKPLAEQTVQLLAKYFPDREEVRHAAAHPNLFNKPGSAKDNLLKQEFNRPGVSIPAGNIVKAVHGRTLIYTYMGNTVEFDLTETTHSKLREIQSMFYSAFGVAETFCHDQIKNMRSDKS